MASQRTLVAGGWAISIFFVLSLFGFAIVRLITDTDNISSGAVLGDNDFNKRYAEHPVPAYAHIIPGLIFIGLAPFQLWKGFRRRHLNAHRMMGRIAVVAGLISAVFAVVFGLLYPWGGRAEALASLVFGGYMAVALVLAVRNVKARNVAAHRRWMIRAFAVSLGVATIRVILVLGENLDLFVSDEAFGIAFWPGLMINAAAAELWLAMRFRTSADHSVK